MSKRERLAWYVGLAVLLAVCVYGAMALVRDLWR